MIARSEEPMTMLAGIEFPLAPFLALGAVAITGCRLNGWISDELLAELHKPFSKATLTAVAMLSLFIGQLCCLSMLR
jgi:hypothetical protein